jgi:DNA topoisomerase-1
MNTRFCTDNHYSRDPGIYKKDNVFYYHTNNKCVNKQDLERVSKFVVPPAWTSVWYASNPKSHVQVYGTDGAGKKQYILSESWINKTNSKKFSRLKSFIEKIDSFKKLIKKCETTTELVFNLLIDTHVRVGNEKYAKHHKSYGLTTLRKKHLVQKGNDMFFIFIGKSGVKQNIKIPEKYHKNLIKLNEKPGKILFDVNSDTLNKYIKEHMGESFTCKDFRTYSANILFIQSFLKNCKEPINKKTIVLNSLKESAELLGHTKSICKKSYVSHNLINYCLDHFELASACSCDKLLSKI